MQVAMDRLSKQLENSLAPIYMVFGDEPFLVAECCSTIRQAALQQGYHERQRFVQDKEFNWQQLFDASQTMSLFTQQQLLELELPDAKPGRDGSVALAEYAANQAPDQILLLFGTQLRKDQQNSKWFKALNEHGVFVPIYTPNRQQLPKFVAQRAAALHLQLEPAAIEQMCAWYEGNLLALQQALEKLNLLLLPQAGKPALVSLAAVEQLAHDNSRYDVFTLREQLLQQNEAGFLHCLQRLFDTGTEPVLIHWVLQQLHFSLAGIRLAHRQQQSIGSYLRSQGVWDSQHSNYEQLARRDSPMRHHARLQLLERLELALKRDSGENPAVLASHIGLLFFPQHQGLAELPALLYNATEI